MSTDDLRDLLHERVVDEQPVDLTASAWTTGRRARRRRGWVVVAGAAAAVVVAAGGVAVIAPDDAGRLPTGPAVASTPPVSEPPSVGPPTSSPPRAVAPDATYRGVDVWWSPDQVEELELPFVDQGPLPRVIDLDVRSKGLDGPVRAAFGVGRSVLLIDGYGSVVSLDVSRLEPVVEDGGSQLSPLTRQMLSPDGARLMFPQTGSVEVYDVATGRWTTIDTEGRPALGATWADSDTVAIPLVDPANALRVMPYGGPTLSEQEIPVLAPSLDMGLANPYGPTARRGASRAQAWGMGVEVPVPEGALSTPELIAVETDAASGVLAIVSAVVSSNLRNKECCAVAGWLDERTVVYESSQARPTLVAWTVGTDELRRLATVRGFYRVASFADLA